MKRSKRNVKLAKKYQRPPKGSYTTSTRGRQQKNTKEGRARLALWHWSRDHK